MKDRPPVELRPDLRHPRPRASWALRCRIAVATLLSCLVVTVGSLLMLVVAVLTLFQARRLYAEVIARGLARFSLWLYGVRIVEHRTGPFPQTQTVYISNHTSSLDVLVIMGLGLPNSRYFMSGFLRAIPPVWLVGSLIGIFWTVPQRFPERRTRIFQNADRRLRRTGESVFLTPEGQVTGRFNKGAFHLATSLGAPILPMFIHIPNDVDPGPLDAGESHAIRPGIVDVYYKPPIPTTDWKAEEVPARRDSVRALYIAWRSELGLPPNSAYEAPS